MSLATPIPLERLCQLALVSRAGFYRWRDALPATDADLDLRDEIQRIALEFPLRHPVNLDAVAGFLGSYALLRPADR